MYTWGYIKDAALAKLDLDEKSAIEQNLINRFPYYANEAMTQICSAIKPKYAYYTFTVYNSAKDAKISINAKYNVDIDTISMSYINFTDNEKMALQEYNEVLSKDLYVNTLIKMPEDFISFGNGVNTVTYQDAFRIMYKDVEAYDSDFIQQGYNYVKCRHSGTFTISYNARWLMFNTSFNDTVKLDAPLDVLDCIPSYIASQCYKIDDEVKANIFRNEYEMFLARIDASDYRNTTTITIDGGW